MNTHHLVEVAGRVFRIHCVGPTVTITDLTAAGLPNGKFLDLGMVGRDSRQPCPDCARVEWERKDEELRESAWRHAAYSPLIRQVFPPAIVASLLAEIAERRRALAAHRATTEESTR